MLSGSFRDSSQNGCDLFLYHYRRLATVPHGEPLKLLVFNHERVLPIPARTSLVLLALVCKFFCVSPCARFCWRCWGGDGPISRRRLETLLRSKAEWGRSTRPSWAICSHFLLQEATPAPNRLTEQVGSRDPGSSQCGCSGGQIGFHGHEAGCVCGRSDASLANRLEHRRVPGGNRAPHGSFKRLRQAECVCTAKLQTTKSGAVLSHC